MDFLPGVEPAWAQEYLEISQKLTHFITSFIVFNITPRLVKIAVKRPEAIIRAFKKNWERLELGERLTDTWEEESAVELEKWAKPPKNEWKIIDLEIAQEFYKAGLTPMEALIEHHANEEDGEENAPVMVGSPPILETMMLLALLAMLTIGVLTFFNSTKPF
jgi:hypothetical protein